MSGLHALCLMIRAYCISSISMPISSVCLWNSSHTLSYRRNSVCISCPYSLGQALPDEINIDHSLTLTYVPGWPCRQGWCFTMASYIIRKWLWFILSIYFSSVTLTLTLTFSREDSLPLLCTSFLNLYQNNKMQSNQICGMANLFCCFLCVHIIMLV